MNNQKESFLQNLFGGKYEEYKQKEAKLEEWKKEFFKNGGEIANNEETEAIKSEIIRIKDEFNKDFKCEYISDLIDVINLIKNVDTQLENIQMKELLNSEQLIDNILKTFYSSKNQCFMNLWNSICCLEEEIERQLDRCNHIGRRDTLNYYFSGLFRAKNEYEKLFSEINYNTILYTIKKIIKIFELLADGWCLGNS